MEFLSSFARIAVPEIKEGLLVVLKNAILNHSLAMEIRSPV